MTVPPKTYHPGEIPANGFLRQDQLVANPKHPNKPVILPFSAATLWRKVKSGEFPQPVKLSARVTAWEVEAIRRWIESVSSAPIKALANSGTKKSCGSKDKAAARISVRQTAGRLRANKPESHKATSAKTIK
jgi:prophage regulatory protein